MKLKSMLTLAACACSFLALAASSTPKGFTDDLDAALAEAKKTGKYVYACFSGSDWCIWCKRLEDEVFADKECDFTGSLKDDYLFVFIDSPNDKSVLSEAAKARNPKLTKEYKIQGFPTALILRGDGVQVEQTGYRKGGAKPYVDYLKDVRKNGDKLIDQHKREKEIDAKYFKDLNGKIDVVLKPLNAQKPTAEELTQAADALDKIVADVEALKFDEADKEFAAAKRDQMTGAVKNLIGYIRKAAENEKAKAEKKTEAK